LLLSRVETNPFSRDDAVAIISSLYVFHSLHEGHRPIHFGDSAPQF
jgi:hypothetical protein